MNKSNELIENYCLTLASLVGIAAFTIKEVDSAEEGMTVVMDTLNAIRRVNNKLQIKSFTKIHERAVEIIADVYLGTFPVDELEDLIQMMSKCGYDSK